LFAIKMPLNIIETLNLVACEALQFRRAAIPYKPIDLRGK